MNVIRLGILTAAWAAMATPLGSPLAAAERTSAAAERTALSLTVYGNGLALVKDHRPVELSLGLNNLMIGGVSPQMVSDSLDLGFGKGVRVLTRTLRPANLNPRSLLAAHLGKPVRLIRTHPETGAETAHEATIVSVDGGVIARIGGQLVSNPEGRWAFPSLPGHLRADPVLAVAAESAEAGGRNLRLRYLTGGLDWRAAYTARWDKGAGKLRLAAWAALKNKAAIDFDNASVSVVAGQVRRVSSPSRPVARGAVMMKTEAAMADASAPVRQAIAGYHLYTLPQAVNLKRGEEVQAALLAPLTVDVKRELVSDGHPAVFGRVRGGGDRPRHPALRLSFTNPKDDRGQPLPAGTVRLYGKDAAGAARFLGEDRMGDVPLGGRVNLTAGQAFDVTVKRRQTDFRREDRNRFEAAFHVELANGGTEPETVKIVETVPGDWRLLDSDQPHTRENNQAVWRITVPARGGTAFSYRVQVRN